MQTNYAKQSYLVEALSNALREWSLFMQSVYHYAKYIWYSLSASKNEKKFILINLHLKSLYFGLWFILHRSQILTET